MHDADLPVPGFLPTPLADPPSDLEDMALMFYGRLVACAERLESAEKQGRAQREEQMHQAHRTMARLAAQRFEFTRLSQRIRSELETLCPDHTETIDNVLGLFARNWDANLRRGRKRHPRCVRSRNRGAGDLDAAGEGGGTGRGACKNHHRCTCSRH